MPRYYDASPRALNFVPVYRRRDDFSARGAVRDEAGGWCQSVTEFCGIFPPKGAEFLRHVSGVKLIHAGCACCTKQ